jgi:hypothetical protein
MIRKTVNVLEVRKHGMLQSRWHVTSVYVLFVLVYRSSVLLGG